MSAVAGGRHSKASRRTLLQVGFLLEARMTGADLDLEEPADVH